MRFEVSQIFFMECKVLSLALRNRSLKSFLSEDGMTGHLLDLRVFSELAVVDRDVYNGILLFYNAAFDTSRN